MGVLIRGPQLWSQLTADESRRIVDQEVDKKKITWLYHWVLDAVLHGIYRASQSGCRSFSYGIEGFFTRLSKIEETTLDHELSSRGFVVSFSNYSDRRIEIEW